MITNNCEKNTQLLAHTRINDIVRNSQVLNFKLGKVKYSKHGVIFFNFQARLLGGGGVKNCPKKYNIDYFGYAVNWKFKF